MIEKAYGFNIHRLRLFKEKAHVLRNARADANATTRRAPARGAVRGRASPRRPRHGAHLRGVPRRGLRRDRGGVLRVPSVRHAVAGCGARSRGRGAPVQHRGRGDHSRREARAHPEPSRRRARNRTGRGFPGRHVRSHSRGTRNVCRRATTGFGVRRRLRGRVPRVARRARARRGVLRRRAAPAAGAVRRARADDGVPGGDPLGNEGGVARVPGRLADPGDGLRRPRRVPRGRRRRRREDRTPRFGSRRLRRLRRRIRRHDFDVHHRGHHVGWVRRRRRRRRNGAAVRASVAKRKKPSKKTKKKESHVPRVRDASVPHPVHARVCVPGVPAAASARALRGPHGLGRGRPSAVPSGERACRGRRRRERAGAAVLAVGRRRREDRRGAVRGAARAGARRSVHPEDAPRRGLRGAHGARRGERRAQRSSKRPSRVPAHQRGGVRRALRRRARPRRRVRGAGHACAVLVPGTRPAARARLARGRGAAVGSERSARKESYADARRARAAARARRGYHRRGDEGGVRLVGVGRIGVGRGVVRAMARRGNSARWYLYERCYWYLYEV